MIPLWTCEDVPGPPAGSAARANFERRSVEVNKRATTVDIAIEKRHISCLIYEEPIEHVIEEGKKQIRSQ